MRLPFLEIFLSQLFFWTASICFGVIGDKFRLMKGNGVKSLQMELFFSLSYSFGVFGVYYLLWDFGIFPDTATIWVRLFCNAPLAYCAIRYLRYLNSIK